MTLAFLMILTGFILLMAGAEYAVRGSVAIANKMNIPPLIIGMTIVAFGTSAPEFVVSISAAMSGSAGISLGNVIGSNIANLMLILGLTAMIYPVKCVRSTFMKDYAVLFGVTLMFAFFALTGTLVRWQGIIMLLILLIFLFYNYDSARKNDETITEANTANSPLSKKSWWMISAITVAGLAAVVYGADILVDGAVRLAKMLGVSDDIIGLTIIAFGTSLPELAASGMAAFRRQNDVALGNIIGSNIWNIVFIMGATSTIVDVDVPSQFIHYDIWVMLGSTLLLLPLMYTKNRLSRGEGLVFVIGYIFYIVSQVMFSKGIWNFG